MPTTNSIRSAADFAIEQYEQAAPETDATLERAVIGATLVLDKARAGFAVKRVSPSDFRLPLRGGLWKAVQEAFRIEGKWRSAASIMFVLTRTKAWKETRATVDGLLLASEVFACVNVERSFCDWPCPVRVLLDVRAAQCKMHAAIGGVVKAISRLEQLEHEYGRYTQGAVPMNAREYYLLHENDRQEWAREFEEKTTGLCVCCWKRRATDTHEIERRSQAPRSWAHKCNYLRVCRECHGGEMVNMDHAKQLAYKFIYDPKYFDLAAWNALNHRQVNFVGVSYWVRVILEQRT